MTPRIAVPEEVRRSLRKHPDQGVAVEDQSTQVQYVLLPLTLYERLQSLIDDPTESDTSESFAKNGDSLDMQADECQEKQPVIDSVQDLKRPISRLRQIRDRYVSRGGKLYTVDEINREVAEGRGESEI